MSGPGILPGAALMGLPVTDRAGVLHALSVRLREIGAVTDTFEAAVLAREEKHPTGLPTAVAAAIPHTDPEHVLVPGFAVAVPAQPVDFGEIGSGGDRTVAAEIVVMLVLADAGDQLTALQTLVARLQDAAAVRTVLESTDDADLERRAREWLSA